MAFVSLAGAVLVAAAASTADPQAAVDRYASARQAGIATLLWEAQAARAAGRHRAAAAAIYKIGCARAVEAVPFLLDHLLFDPAPVRPGAWTVSTGSSGPYEHAPCVLALIEVGSPCLDPLLARVQADDRPAFRRYAALVVRGVLGRDFAGAYLAAYMKGVNAPPARRRVQEVSALCGEGSPTRVVIGHAP